jgi:phospholipase/lecithinase/hemolysin
LSYQVLLYAQASPPPLLYAQASPPPPSNRPLFVVVTGANDYLKPTPLTPNVVVGNIVQAIDVLHQLGARNVMVLNLPDLGTIPLVAGLSAEQRAGLSFLSAAHNIALESVLQAWGSSHPDVNLIPIDVNVVLQGLPASMNRTVPALDALVPPTGPYPTSFCLFLGPETCPNVPTFDVELQYLYWDAEHPTTAVHRLLGQHLYDTLTQ